MAKVKKEGVITVEEAKGTDTTVEVVEGMQLIEVTYSIFCNKCRKMEAN